jgi:hypothetical protein
MSLNNDIAEIKDLIEKDIFKPASKKELEKRKAGYKVRVRPGQYSVIEYSATGDHSPAYTEEVRVLEETEEGQAIDSFWAGAYIVNVQLSDGTIIETDRADLTVIPVKEDIFKPATQKDLKQRKEDIHKAYDLPDNIEYRNMYYDKEVKVTHPQVAHGVPIELDIEIGSEEAPDCKVGHFGYNFYFRTGKGIRQEKYNSRKELESGVERLLRSKGFEIKGWVIRESINEAGEELFAPATDKDLAKRRKQYWGKRGPMIKKIQDLIPKIKDLEDEYRDESASWMGHYSETDSGGEPSKISFDIKMGAISIPDKVRKAVEDSGQDQAFEEEYQLIVGDTLTSFIKDVEMEYDFIKEVFQEGRSGGWLVFEIESVPFTEDAGNIMYDFGEMKVTEDDPSPTDLDSYYQILTNYHNALDKRIQDLYALEKELNEGKYNLEKWLENIEAWESFLEYIKEG